MPTDPNDRQTLPPESLGSAAPGPGARRPTHAAGIGHSVLAPHAHGRTSRRHRPTGRSAHDLVAEPKDRALTDRPDDRSEGTTEEQRARQDGPSADGSPPVVAVATPIAVERPTDESPPATLTERAAPRSVEPSGNELPPPWERADNTLAASAPPRRRRFRRGLVVVALGLIAALIGFGLQQRVGRDDATAPPTTAATTGTSSSTSSIPSVAALRPLAASVRILAGGPDAMGNGGTSDRVLLRRPTSLARIRAGIVLADAGTLRLARPDGRIEGIEIDGLPDNALIDHVAALTNGRVLAIDASTTRFFVIDGIGSSVVRATASKAGDIASPVYAVGDDDGGALIADPGSGSVWKWSPDAPPVRLLGGLIAPVHVAALADGGALVTDRGAGQVLRIDGPNRATVIATNARANQITSGVVRLRSTPLAAVAAETGSVQILMLDGAISRVAQAPQANDRASIVTEFLSGATSLLADGTATLIVESGERRIRSITATEPGRSNIATVFGDTRWPRFNPGALRAKDVVLIDPTGVAVRPDGSVVVADRGANVIWQLNEDGSAVRLAGTGVWGTSADNPDGNESAIASPTDVALGADGAVVFTEPVFGRIRAVRANGALVSLTTKTEVDRQSDPLPASTAAGSGVAAPGTSSGQPLFSPGPLAVDGGGALVAGDRFLGGLWRVTSAGVAAVSGPALDTRFVFASTERAGTIVAMDAFGKAVRVSDGSVVIGAEGLVGPREFVRAGASDGTNIAVAVSSDGTGSGSGPRSSADFSVIRREAATVPHGARIVALSAFEGSLFAVTNGARGAVVRFGGEDDVPLTSTALGEDQGRANETNLADPVALDVADDDALIVTDRGGGRVRALRAGQLTTLAGNGTVDRQNDPRANAFGQSLSDLRDAHANRSGTISVVDGPRLVTIDGTGLVVDRRVADPTGDDLVLRSIDQGPDGATLAVADDGRLFRIDDDGATILTTAPALSNVRVEDNGAVWGVTNTGRVVQLDGDRFVDVETPRDLAIIACDERDGRLVVVGRDGTVAVRVNGEWFRMSPSTTVTADRRTNRAATPRPTDIAVLRDGGVVVADAGRDALLVYRSS